MLYVHFHNTLRRMPFLSPHRVRGDTKKPSLSRLGSRVNVYRWKDYFRKRLKMISVTPHPESWGRRSLLNQPRSWSNFASNGIPRSIVALKSPNLASNKRLSWAGPAAWSPSWSGVLGDGARRRKIYSAAVKLKTMLYLVHSCQVRRQEFFGPAVHYSSGSKVFWSFRLSEPCSTLVNYPCF
jgi:hypothetical protein